MTAKIILGSLIFITGLASLLLGIIFFIGAQGVESRLTIGKILMAGGLAVFIAGIILFRKGMQSSPAGIKRALLKLARMNNGEITDEAILGKLGDSDDVKMQLDLLLSSGIAKEIMKNNRRTYIFRDFQMKLVTKVCPYCGNDYPVRGVVENCPSCGGDLKMRNSASTEEEEKFSMDEEDE